MEIRVTFEKLPDQSSQNIANLHSSAARTWFHFQLHVKFVIILFIPRNMHCNSKNFSSQKIIAQTECGNFSRTNHVLLPTNVSKVSHMQLIISQRKCNFLPFSFSFPPYFSNREFSIFAFINKLRCELPTKIPWESCKLRFCVNTVE